jgi:hypothetical protein
MKQAAGRFDKRISCPPLYGTARTPGRKSLGQFVWRTSQLLGKPFFDWQRHVVDIAFEIDEYTGEFAYDDVTIVLPRQQGKTELILPVMTHRSTAFPIPQRTMYTAQTAAEARKKWEDIHVARLKESDLRPLFEARMALQREAIIWKNGSFWMPGSTTGKTGGTGDTLDLGVIDEMWSRPDNRTELGMKPTMLTRRNSQLWRLSMVPGLSRLKGHNPKYMRDQMAQGRDRVTRGVNTGTCYFEWSLPLGPDVDPGDPVNWRKCMPGLQVHGGLINETSVRSDYNTLPIVDFTAEYLGWFPEDHVPKWTIIRRQIWEDLFADGSHPAGTLALAIDVDPDRLRCSIAAVGRRDDDDWHAEIVEPGSMIAEGVTGMDWVEDRMIQLCEKHDPCAVVIDPRSPAAAFIIPLRNRGIEVITPNVQEYAAACGQFFDATGQNWKPEDEEEGRGQRIRHIAQDLLTRAVAHARTTASPTSGSFSWLRVGTSDLTPLIAVTLALYGYELMKPDDYDVDNSIPDDYGQCRYCYACEIHGYLTHYPHCERPK